MTRRDHEQRPSARSLFGLWRHLDLIHNGRTFLRRRGVDVRLGGVMVHHIDAPDPGIDLHDHPWSFISIVLRGGYCEVWAPTRMASQAGGGAMWQTRTWRRWSVHRMPLNVAHRIYATTDDTLTLVIRGPKRRRWGFYLPDGWIDWAQYDYDARRPVSELRR